MNKKELVEKVSNLADTDKNLTNLIVATTLDVIKDTVAEGQTVTLNGFGRFAVKERPARNGVNPKTGKPITIKARKSPVFKPSAQLKEQLN